MKTNADPRSKLFTVVEGQQGYFTAQQAEKAGYRKSNHSYHVKAGNWIRERRGIYRLAAFPRTDDSQLVVLSLWSRDRQGRRMGVYSHETALSIHDLSDTMPAKLHMTVPKGFRRTSQIPRELILHYGEIRPSDIEERRGYRVTKPLRTILDLLAEEGAGSEIARQAFLQGVTRGLIRRSEAKSERLLEDARQALLRWLEHEKA